MSQPVVTRFAPSPTGLLHLGHAYSALFARDAAGETGRFLLRIEDIDATRCRPEFIDAAEREAGGARLPAGRVRIAENRQRLIPVGISKWF